VNAGILLPVVPQNGKKKTVKGRFAGADSDDAALKRAVQGDFLFCSLQVFKSHRHMGKEFFSLRRQFCSSVGAGEKSASQGMLQIFDGSCNVGLVASQRQRGFCKALKLCYIIKGSVIIVADLHKSSPKRTINFVNVTTEILLYQNDMNTISN